jgi:3(or 17)beta-hydroxysteroid dehydrogenase
MSARLAGKVAVITGAAGFFGREMVALFVAEGARVVACDLPGKEIEKLAAPYGAHVIGVDHDVLIEADWARVVAEALRIFGKMDILVNNAGIATDGSPQDPERVTLHQFRAISAVNVEGVMLGCQAAIRAMRETGGAIVNISSIAALNPSPRMIAYGASKAAVRHMTRTVAKYCTDQKYPIRCNSVHPGWFMTPLVQESRTPAELEAQELAIPMGRFGEIADVAAATLFLASDEAKYMTGAKLVVDGGVSMEV